jgi:flagella basal body P-ring formation protein FlgA
LTIELEVDGRLTRVLPVRAEVEVFRSVLVTRKKLEKGARFTKEDIELERRPASQIPGGALSDLETVLGRTAAGPLLPGTILRVQSLFDPPAVRQGQMVRAVVVRGNVEITVEARAVDSGKVGDVIRVENTQTRKIIRAKVLNEKMVSVEEKLK